MIREFSNLRLDDAAEDAGGKGANLDELCSAGLQVPPGFVPLPFVRTKSRLRCVGRLRRRIPTFAQRLVERRLTPAGGNWSLILPVTTSPGNRRDEPPRSVPWAPGYSGTTTARPRNSFAASLR